MRILYESMQGTKQFCLFLASVGFSSQKAVKACEDNEGVVNTIKSNHIRPYLRHVDLPLCCLHYEHRKGAFELILILSKMQIASMGTKPESGPSLIRLLSIAMGHVHSLYLLPEHSQELEIPLPIRCYEHFNKKNMK